MFPWPWFLALLSLASLICFSISSVLQRVSEYTWIDHNGAWGSKLYEFTFGIHKLGRIYAPPWLCSHLEGKTKNSPRRAYWAFWAGKFYRDWVLERDNYSNQLENTLRSMEKSLQITACSLRPIDIVTLRAQPVSLSDHGRPTRHSPPVSALFVLFMGTSFQFLVRSIGRTLIDLLL